MFSREVVLDCLVIGYGIGKFYRNGMYEQWFMENPYGTVGTQEWWTKKLEDYYYYKVK
ncbi:MAG: hypothetical protein PVH88_15530 [Ignavibacteria bacterium]